MNNRNIKKFEEVLAKSTSLKLKTSLPIIPSMETSRIKRPLKFQLETDNNELGCDFNIDDSPLKNNKYETDMNVFSSNSNKNQMHSSDQIGIVSKFDIRESGNKLEDSTKITTGIKKLQEVSLLFT